MYLAKTDSLIYLIPPELVPIIILIVSLIGFTFIIERFIFFSRWSLFNEEQILKFNQFLKLQEWDKASNYLKSLNNGPTSLMLRTAIKQKEKDQSLLEVTMLSSGSVQIGRMQRFLSGLGTIATISPLLGVLGTVLGIIRAFAEGSGTRGAEIGISEALITTALGLVVAIPAYVFYNYFNNKKEEAINEMESMSEQTLKLLK